MPKNYDEQSHQYLPDQANYWSKLPTPNRTYLDFLFETDEDKAIKEFEKFVDIIEKKKVKKKEPEDACPNRYWNYCNVYLHSVSNSHKVKKMNKEKSVIQKFHKSLFLISTCSFSIFMVADILSSTIGLGY